MHFLIISGLKPSSVWTVWSISFFLTYFILQPLSNIGKTKNKKKNRETYSESAHPAHKSNSLMYLKPTEVSYLTDRNLQFTPSSCGQMFLVGYFLCNYSVYTFQFFCQCVYCTLHSNMYTQVFLQLWLYSKGKGLKKCAFLIWIIASFA